MAEAQGWAELAGLLHPQSDLESMWAPHDLGKFTASGAVPPLHVLVGARAV